MVNKTPPVVTESFRERYSCMTDTALESKKKFFARYKDIFHLKLATKNIYFSNHPELVRAIIFEKSKSFKKLNTAGPIVKYFGKEGLVFQNDYDKWKDAKTLFSPFFSLTAMMKYVDVFSKVSESTLSHWIKEARSEGFDLISEMRIVAMHNLFNALMSGAPFPVRAFSKATEEFLRLSLEETFSLNKLLWWLPSKRKNTLKANVAYITNCLEILVKHRVDQRDAKHDLLSTLIDAYGGEKKDVLSVELLDHLSTFVFAGHETTACLLTWLFVIFHQYPEIEQKVVEEIRIKINGEKVDYDALQTLSYTKAVIFETLRYYPTFAALPRQIEGKAEACGYQFKNESMFLISLFDLHHNEKFWNAPHEFKPERFINAPYGQENKFAYCPFGAGERSCIGKEFALTETLVTLVHILPNYRLKFLKSKAIEPFERISILPQKPIHFNVEKRLSA